MLKKQVIVNKFLEKGKILTENAADFLEDKEITHFLAKNYSDLVLDERHFFESENDRIKILKNFTEKPVEITKKDFVSFYTSKFEKIKNIIIARQQKDFVSINKIDPFSKNEVNLIGMVREIKNIGEKTTILLEDMTDSKKIIFDSKQEEIELDDVVAVKAIPAGEILLGKQIIFPDIPLRQPAKGSGKACFISDLHLDESPQADNERFFSWFERSDIKYLFVAGDIGDAKLFENMVERYCYDKKIFVIPGHTDNEMNYPTTPESFEGKNIISLSNPSMIELNGVKILMIHKADVNMIKKRYLGKSKVILKEDYLVLDEVPDIVHFGHTHDPQILNYKSTTFVNSGSPLKQFLPVVISFSSREAQQIKIE